MPARRGEWPAREKKIIYCRPARKRFVAGEGKKNYIMPAGEEKVRGRREKKNIIYRRPARWGEWPARKKKMKGIQNLKICQEKTCDGILFFFNYYLTFSNVSNFKTLPMEPKIKKKKNSSSNVSNLKRYQWSQKFKKKKFQW
jgi:hypothetical protein